MGADAVLAWSLEAEAGAPGIAREIVHAVLREWDMPHLSADVELVVSELVTNALQHGAPHRPTGLTELNGDGSAINLSMMRRGPEVMCAVRDACDRRPVRREPDSTLETGRGLNLVACFARRWGVLPTLPTGKYVWAQFE